MHVLIAPELTEWLLGLAAAQPTMAVSDWQPPWVFVFSMSNAASWSRRPGICRTSLASEFPLDALPSVPINVACDVKNPFADPGG